jgi:hypothetical protein
MHGHARKTNLAAVIKPVSMDHRKLRPDMKITGIKPLHLRIPQVELKAHGTALHASAEGADEDARGPQGRE